jgi:hypothetical protein
MTALGINRPDVRAEVIACVLRYEEVLISNDLTILDELFWASPHTIRFGPGEVLYGQREIQRFRMARDGSKLARTIRRLEVTTFGDSFATSSDSMFSATR